VLGFSPYGCQLTWTFRYVSRIDERVPVDALRFGTRVLDRFIDLVLTLLTHSQLLAYRIAHAYCG